MFYSFLTSMEREVTGLYEAAENLVYGSPPEVTVRHAAEQMTFLIADMRDTVDRL